MKNRFFSRFDSDYLRKAIIYFTISVLLIAISLVFGFEKNNWAAFVFPFGIAFLFYALLRPWGNAKYYGIMCIIILLTLFLGIGIGILTKWQLYNYLGKDFGEYIELIVPIGVIVGIIGIFRFRKYD
jgi:hypothetical protein